MLLKQYRLKFMLVVLLAVKELCVVRPAEFVQPLSMIYTKLCSSTLWVSLLV